VSSVAYWALSGYNIRNMSTVPEKIEDLKDPRQLRTIALWRNPKSETFGNLRASAIQAGYSETYADNLTQLRPVWLSLSVERDIERVKRAERNLDNIIDVDIDLNNKQYDIDLVKLQADVSKFVLKTLAKAKYTEDDEPAPPNVQINIVNYSKDSAPAPVVHEAEAVDVAPSEAGRVVEDNTQ